MNDSAGPSTGPSAAPKTTPSQTVGPFLHIGLVWPDGPYVVPDDAPGAIWLRGTVVDGQADPVPDALIETWQADPDGRYDQPGDDNAFRGFGRCPTDAEGGYAIRTVKPGPVPYVDGDSRTQASHIDVSVFSRGLLNRVVTRIYFDDEPDANAVDPVLDGLRPDERETLIARTTEDGYRFDIRLRGERETVFFAV